ncbi:MAG: DUF1574 domain-containing protein [Cyanobacteria bacterium J06560_2]
MLGHLPRQKTDADPATLLPWLRETILRPEHSLDTGVQVRLRGNILHVLCESSAEQLTREYVLMRLVRSLLDPDVQDRFEREFPQVYQIYVYSRIALEPKPVWSAPIYLNRLERHLERLVQSAADVDQVVATARESDIPISSEQLSNISLARQGDSDAIARYLSEALSALNVGVKVSARVVPGKARKPRVIGATHTLKAAQEEQADLSVEPVAIDTAESGSASHKDSALVKERASDNDSDNDSDKNALAENDTDLAKTLVSRLWIFCEASYSPDPLLIAEPIAQRLRQLHLNQFQDAVITIQVIGEAASDWRLRVDLTPPDEMLQEWSRWGDVPALSQLVNQISKSYGLKLVTEVKKDTLHLISYPINPVDSLTGAPLLASEDDLCRRQIDVDGLVSGVSRLLEEISPQGLQRAMLYGPSTDDISPEWLRGIDLPAMTRPALIPSTASLAASGDLPALAHCLTRALNPDIRDQLATGGIRVQLLIKDRLLHIMADGPVCPPKHAIVPLITQTLQELHLPEIEGLRLYGRRAGQKQPIWSHGRDYTERLRLVPEAKPEFAASDAYAGELITAVSDETLAGELEAVGEESDRVNPIKLLGHLVRRALIKSQMFTPVQDNGALAVNLPGSFQSAGGKMALLWGAAGLLLAVQFDFMVGQALRQVAAPVQRVDSATATASSARRGVEPVQPSPFNDELSQLEWPNDDEEWSEAEGRREEAARNSDDGWREGEWAETDDAEGFFGSSRSERIANQDFTSSAIDDSELLYSPQQEFVSTTSLLAGSRLPSFRSQQLDEKLALYRQLVERSGPPDVLIIGSSRALRGIDPAALEQALALNGHEDLRIFNFGVNGATAQVVDLILRRLISPNQLPQMVVWADGARAFNSGRTDVTFNAIATSEGYRQLEASDPVDGVNGLALGSLSDQLTVRATNADQSLSDLFGQVSSAYTNRTKIRSAIGQGLGAITPEFDSGSSTSAGVTPTGKPTETSLIDYDGFLALSTRFNPATYYQDHPRVAGAYDGDYKAFRMEGEQTDALRSILRFATEKEFPVVFVNTPLTDEYLDSHRNRSEKAFQRYMLQTAERYSEFTYRDLGRAWPQGYDYFSDPSHLNRYGAYQVSQRLSQDPLISWPEAVPREGQ